MKLLVKSDDYGFTKAVTDGICDGIENGIITSTGLFANMPSAAYAVERIKAYPEVCFGIDINVVAGKPCADSNLIQSLVNQDSGEFFLSNERTMDSQLSEKDLWPYEECKIEAIAQINRFISLVGKKPEYVTGHSISKIATDYVRAIRDVSHDFGIPFAPDLIVDNGLFSIPGVNKKPFDIQAQLEANPEANALLQLELNKKKEKVILRGHCGYVDNELFKYSTFTIIRVKDHVMYTSDKIKKWIFKNNVQLISFRDLLSK